MLPTLVRITSVGDDGIASEVVLSYKLAQWLAYPIMVCSEPTRTLKVYENIVGPERMGAALDAALTRIAGNHGRHPSVLRAELLRAFAEARPLAEAPFLVQAGDTLVVGGAAADDDVAALDPPLPDTARAVPDWFLEVEYGMLLCGRGTLIILAEMEPVAFPRFLPAGREPGLARVASMAISAMPAHEVNFLASFSPAERAAEYCAFLSNALPSPLQLVDWPRTNAAAALGFSRALLRATRQSVNGAEVLTVNDVVCARRREPRDLRSRQRRRVEQVARGGHVGDRRRVGRAAPSQPGLLPGAALRLPRDGQHAARRQRAHRPRRHRACH